MTDNSKPTDNPKPTDAAMPTDTSKPTDAPADGRVRIEHADGVAVLTIDRPPINALTAPFLDRIADAVSAVAADPDARAAVLTGAGRALSAGMDLKALPGLDLEGQAAVVDALNRCYEALYAFPKPLVAAANGSAVAGGAFLLLAADARLAAAGPSRFGLSEVRVGVPFPVAAIEIARAELTPSAARRLMLGGRLIDLDGALAAGLIDEAVEARDLPDMARARALTLAESPPAAYAAIKAQLRGPALGRIRAALGAAPDPHRRPWFAADPSETAARLI